MKTQVSRMLFKKKTVLAFPVEAVADLNAVKGLIRTLDLGPSSALIRSGDEITPVMAQKAFPGFRRVREFSSAHLRVSFSTEGPDRWAGTGKVIFNYVPYKFFALNPSDYSAHKRKALRRAMGAGGGRRIICVSCTSRNEVLFVMKAAQGLCLPQKPLFIFGLRKSDRKLASLLTKKGFKTLDRHDSRRPFSEFSSHEAVVLNTTGEFFEILRAADLAVIGHDRNILEPAFLRVPILYFAAPLGMTRGEEKMARMFGLIWRKNRLAKNFLDRNQGALPIEIPEFSRQMKAVLKTPGRLIQGGRKAIREFERKEIPAARKRLLNLLKRALRDF